jgi:1,3-beta-glucanosyltransferase GAS1
VALPAHPFDLNKRFSQGLQRAFGDPIDNLYTNNASAPLQARAGLRQLYKFGLYNHCGYVDDKKGICGNYSVATRFQPYESLTSDMLSNYSQFTDAIIFDTTFRNDGYLGSSSKAAYYMLLLGTICTSLAMAT